MGTWYEIDHVKHQAFQSDSWVCTQAQYTNLKEDGTFDIYNSSQGKRFGKRFGVKGDGHCPDATGHCYVGFFGQDVDEPNYLVVDTDYTTYSVVYACDFGFTYLWFLSRTPTVDDEQMDRYNEIARANLPNFNFDKMADLDIQNDQCRYAREHKHLQESGDDEEMFLN